MRTLKYVTKASAQSLLVASKTYFDPASVVRPNRFLFLVGSITVSITLKSRCTWKRRL